MLARRVRSRHFHIERSTRRQHAVKARQREVRRHAVLERMTAPDQVEARVREIEIRLIHIQHLVPRRRTRREILGADRYPHRVEPRLFEQRQRQPLGQLALRTGVARLQTLDLFAQLRHFFGVAARQPSTAQKRGTDPLSNRRKTRLQSWPHGEVLDRRKPFRDSSLASILPWNSVFRQLRKSVLWRSSFCGDRSLT